MLMRFFLDLSLMSSGLLGPLTDMNDFRLLAMEAFRSCGSGSGGSAAYSLALVVLRFMLVTPTDLRLPLVAAFFTPPLFSASSFSILPATVRAFVARQSSLMG